MHLIFMGSLRVSVYVFIYFSFILVVVYVLFLFFMKPVAPIAQLVGNLVTF